MKASVIREYKKIAIEEVRKPVLLDNHVLIRVVYASICGSDQHILKGTLNPGKMITGIMNLEDAQKGFDLLENEPAKHLKILLKV